MKKIEFYLIAIFLAFSLNSSVAVSSILDGTKVVSDEDIEWLEGEDVVSTSKFIQQTLVLDPEELKDVETLDLHSTSLHTSGLKKITDELLPYLPNLKFLNLYASQLRTREDLEILASILERFGSLQYVSIVANGIANQALSFVKEHEEQKEITDKFQQKVVFSFNALLEDKFPLAEREHYNDWYQTHIRYYNTNYYLPTLPY
ncbi:MAG: hypothetical protein K2X02_04820 [Alphaproteobacteria bacterium]|nr:hypothetical protein [Alphaproteobacteria bacterium]